MCVMTAKLQGESRGREEEDKSQSDKISGDCRKTDVTTPCQCVCHNKGIKVTTTTPAKPFVVDLTVSPCKDSTQLLPPAPKHRK